MEHKKECSCYKLPQQCASCGHSEDDHDGGMGSFWCDGNGTHNVFTRDPNYDKRLCKCEGFMAPQSNDTTINKTLPNMRALVLSGGGAKGAYQAGALSYILGELETHYDIVCGISVGAINSANVAMFPKGQEKQCSSSLLEFWNTVKPSDVFVRWFPFGRLHAIWKPSLYNSAPLLEYLQNRLNQEAIKNSGKKLRVGAVSLTTGQYKLFDENHAELAKAVYASAAYPLAFLPIDIDGEKWLDGGLKEVTPLKAAIDLGADEIDVIIADCKVDNGSIKQSPNVLDIGERGLSLMNNEIMDNDISSVLEINDILKTLGPYKDKRYIKIRIIRPNSSLGDSLIFEQDNIQPMIKVGYQDALNVLNV